METRSTATGLNSVFAPDAADQRFNMWRPWVGNGDKSAKRKASSMHEDVSDAKRFKALQFVHPVKLYWPKSKFFDYLYREAEMLLRNYPVQATICPYDDSTSDEDLEDDEEEEVEKELN